MFHEHSSSGTRELWLLLLLLLIQQLTRTQLYQVSVVQMTAPDQWWISATLHCGTEFTVCMFSGSCSSEFYIYLSHCISFRVLVMYFVIFCNCLMIQSRLQCLARSTVSDDTVKTIVSRKVYCNSNDTVIATVSSKVYCNCLMIQS